MPCALMQPCAAVLVDDRLGKTSDVHWLRKPALSLPSETLAIGNFCAPTGVEYDGQRSAPHQTSLMDPALAPENGAPELSRPITPAAGGYNGFQARARREVAGPPAGGAVPVRPRPSGWPLGGRILPALGPARPAVIVVHVRTGRTKLSGAVGHVALPSIRRFGDAFGRHSPTCRRRWSTNRRFV
jgi:hypothetical protein